MEPPFFGSVKVSLQSEKNINNEEDAILRLARMDTACRGANGNWAQIDSAIRGRTRRFDCD
jgi:hypothetical protein